MYDKTDLYLGPTVDGTKLGNWIALVAVLQTQYPTAIVYPGHGDITNISDTAFQTTDYLNYFKQALCTGANMTTVVTLLAARYPTNNNFTLSYVPINEPTWVGFQLYLISNTTFCNQFTISPRPTPTPTPASGSNAVCLNFIYITMVIITMIFLL